jgi:hypothetical protein
MKRLARGRRGGTGDALEIEWLSVNEMTFDIVQAVVANIGLHVKGAVVDLVPRSGR